MSPVSVVALPSKLCLPKWLISSTHQLKPFLTTTQSPRMCRRRKTVTPSMKISLNTAVSDDDALQKRIAISLNTGESDDNGVQRRKGDHYSNIWHNDFIESLATAYGASCYGEHANKPISKVNEIFNGMSMEDGESISPLNDLIQRLWMVDNVERLGIDRHFENEIKTSLDYVHKELNEEADLLSKQALILRPGRLIITDISSAKEEALII